MHGHIRISLALAWAAASAHAQPNLLDNPGFDQDLSGWDIVQERPAVWDPEDAVALPDSGSARLTHDEPLGGGYLSILRQCVPIDGADQFRISGLMFNPPDQPISGSAAIQAIPTRFADCTGAVGFIYGPDDVSSSGNWQYREATFSTEHPTIDFQAIEIRLMVLKAQAVETPRVALFDEIELVSLTPQDAIFASGFEPK